jgi:AcrR family transcriptional regulator
MVETRKSVVRGRGRPRSEAAKTAILSAAAALLDEGGPGAVTMEAVAARAGVGKPTLYRWWPDRHAVAMAAMMAPAAVDACEAVPKTALAELRAQLHQIALRFARPAARHATSLIAAADPESELAKAFRNHFVLAQRGEGKALLLRAIEELHLRVDLDVEVALDMLYGPIIFRLLIGHARLEAAFIDSLFDDVLRGIAASEPPVRKRARARAASRLIE